MSLKFNLILFAILLFNIYYYIFKIVMTELLKLLKLKCNLVISRNFVKILI